MIMVQGVFNPFARAPRTSRQQPERPRARGEARPYGTDSAQEELAMTALNALKRDVPPPSPERMAAGKARLLALAAERRRERLIDLAG